MRALKISARNAALCLVVGLIVLPAAAAPSGRDGTHDHPSSPAIDSLARIYEQVVAVWSRLLFEPPPAAAAPVGEENPAENEADRGPMIDPNG